MMSLTTVLLASSAMAYEHTGWMWSPDQMPIGFAISDYLEDSLPQSADATTGLYYQEEVMVKSYCNWHWIDMCDELLTGYPRYEDATCADFNFEYEGIDEGHEGFTSDGRTKIYFDDPSDDLGTGVNGLTVTRRSGVVVKEQDGMQYYEVLDSDIGFNNDIDWGTTEEIDASCSGQVMCLECTATHEVGHLLGLDHSCEQNEPCSEEPKLNATMFWSGGPCDTSRASINSDDISGITAIYGPFATFTTDPPTPFGDVPLEVDFKVDASTELQNVRWRFGDGAESEEMSPTHLYESEGQFTVTVDFEGVSEVCGEWSYTYRELAHVLACDAPQAEFSVEQIGELEYQMVNLTDVTTYGCLDEISWDVYSGQELIESYGAWSPKILFPEAGSYTVKLQTAGPGGGAAAELTFDVSADPVSSCSTLPPLPQIWGLGALLSMGILTRRRKDA